MELPNDLHVCIPATGFVPQYVNLIHEHAPAGDPLITIGTVIPFMLHELNARGFSVRGLMNSPREPAPLGVASTVIAPSGVGKSTTWNSLQSLYEEATGGRHKGIVALEGTTAGVVAALEAHYDEQRQMTPALLHADEFSSVLRAVTVSKHNSSMPQFLNTVLKGDTFEKSLRGAQSGGREAPKVTRPRLTGCFYTVREALGEGIFNEDMTSTGFLARLLVLLSTVDDHTLVPMRKRFRDIDKTGWFTAVEGFKQWLNWLDLWDGSGKTEITVSEGAYAAYDSMIERLNEEYGGSSTALQSVMQRAEQKAHTIGALYATTRGKREISVEDAEAATNVLWESLRSIQALVGHGLGGGDKHELRVDARREKILNILRRVEALGAKGSDFYFDKREGRISSNKREQTELFEVLLEQGQVLAMTPDPYRKPGPGAKATRYWLAEHVPADVLAVLTAKATPAYAKEGFPGAKSSADHN